MKFISNKRYQRMEDQYKEQMRRMFEQKDEIERLKKENDNLVEIMSNKIDSFKRGLTELAGVFDSRIKTQSIELIKCFEEQAAKE